MLFASKAFFIFLPVVLVIYHLLHQRGHKYTFLLAASWLFYSWVSPQYLWVILLCTLIDYIAALKIEAAPADRKQRWLWVSIVANVGLLAVFKYTPFLYDNLAIAAGGFGVGIPDRTWQILLPLGISFHTFQGISYTVDVYRGRIGAVRSFRDYALFVAFFPQMAAGPIVRAVEFLPQLVSPPKVSARQIADGLHFFLLGLIKKLFIADQIDVLFVSPVFADPAAFDPSAHRWAMVAWLVQIYCDFSGYSDMAVGCAKWFGFELPRNFNFPYLATSVTEFWRRWHMSLSTWLRDYLYFPMGGSRGSGLRTYFNLMTVFAICGLWHGATWAWLVYGLVMGTLICLHRAWDQAVTGIGWADAVRGTWAWATVAWFATMVQIMGGLILVRMPSWEKGGILFHSLLGLDLLGPWWSPALPVWVPLLILPVVLGHVYGRVRPGVGNFRDLPSPIRAAVYVAAVVLVVGFSPGVGKTFIYFDF